MHPIFDSLCSWRNETKQRALSVGGAAMVLLLAAVPVEAQRTADGDGPFAGLAGHWSGGGTITLASGEVERIRCRATYTVSSTGINLQQTLRCASDGSNFDLRSTVTHREGTIQGTWTEMTHNSRGAVSGGASDGVIEANVVGPDFSATLSVQTRGERQTVTINSRASTLRQVSISMARTAR